MMHEPDFKPAAGLRMTPSPTSVQSSHFTTASAPAGIGAPVITRIVWPGVTASVGTLPAVTSSSSRSVGDVSLTSIA
jgi:hypothetical protein